MSKPAKIPVKWSVPKVWSVPDRYTVPFPYSIPTDYSVPDVFEETTAITTTQSITETTSKITSQPQKSEKKFEIDPLTASLITAGMVGMFGGVAIGRISKRKSKKEVKEKDGS